MCIRDRFNGSIKDFLSLDNITYPDKVWVCTRLMTRNQKFQFAVACATSVIDIFNVKYPTDSRMRDLITFMQQISNIETLSDENREKLFKLRADAAVYAADAAAYAAVYAAAYAADARTQQEELNLIILLEVMEIV